MDGLHQGRNFFVHAIPRNCGTGENLVELVDKYNLNCGHKKNAVAKDFSDAFLLVGPYRSYSAATESGEGDKMSDAGSMNVLQFGAYSGAIVGVHDSTGADLE